MHTDQQSRLRVRRESCGLSREQLAIRGEVSPEYIRRLELGLHTPSLEMARRIADALDTTVDTLWPPLPAAGNE